MSQYIYIYTLAKYLLDYMLPWMLYCRNMLTMLDGWCSGRRSCNVHVSDLHEFRSVCLMDLPSYLQARYTCESGKWKIAMFISVILFTTIYIQLLMFTSETNNKSSKYFVQLFVT